MNHWCESCARKNLCYVVDDRPKCFVPITNTASGTPYLVEISPISRDSHEIDTPQTERKNCTLELFDDDGNYIEPQTDNGIGCSRCESRYDCYDRNMPHAVRCNNYGKITDEP